MDQDGFLYYVEGFRDDLEDYVEEMDCRQGLSLSSPDDVLKYVDEYGISSIRMWFTDMLGFLKSFSITPKELKGAFEDGMGFDGSSIEGYQRIQESDMVAVPVASTAQVLPFRSGGSRSIRMFAEIRNPDGSPYASHPRVVLRSDARLRFGDVRRAMVAIEEAGFQGVGLIASRAGAEAGGE